jgi:predicted small secreted protein
MKKLTGIVFVMAMAGMLLTGCYSRCGCHSDVCGATTASSK